MKKIIEELNLPKQILDKTDKFITTLFGPSMQEMGELFADKIRFKRLKNQIKIFKDTIEIVEKNGLEIKKLSLKTLVPLIEHSSLEEDEVLQKKWSNLIANIASSPENGLEPKLVNTLGALSSLEAKILDFIHSTFLIKRKVTLKNKQSNIFFTNSWQSENDVPLDYVLIMFESIKKEFNLTEEFTKIYIDNLVTLGLIQFEEPEIEIENDYPPSGAISGSSVDIDLDISAHYYTSRNFHLTAYGNYFINQCKIE